jgi:transmembrane sensor
MSERLTILFEKHLADTLTREERIEFMGLLLQPGMKAGIDQLMETAWQQTGMEQGLPEHKKQLLLQQVKQDAPVITLYPRRQTWNRWMAAASILILISLGAYFMLVDTKKTTTVDGPVATTEVPAPAVNRAMISLSNGQVVYLDSMQNGTVLNTNGFTIIKTADGRIEYKGQTNEIIYNTLTNPRGSKVIDMTMSDGSHVWLNAGSSVRYPVVFAGNERKVEVNGEAYFEIAHNAARPFIVSKGAMNVQVLGTHFNINAYDDETNIKVTLLEGSVKVTTSQSATGSVQSLVLKPGQQALVDRSAIQQINPNLEEVMAWKNGFFHFDRADIPTVMRQLARWYDLEINYKGAIPKREFGGEMQKDLPLSSLLRLLEKSNIRVNLAGKKLTVLP